MFALNRYEDGSPYRIMKDRTCKTFFLHFLLQKVAAATSKTTHYIFGVFKTTQTTKVFMAQAASVGNVTKNSLGMEHP